MYAEINCISYFDFIFRLTAITLPSPVVLPSHCAMFSYPIDLHYSQTSKFGKKALRNLVLRATNISQIDYNMLHDKHQSKFASVRINSISLFKRQNRSFTRFKQKKPKFF